VAETEAEIETAQQQASSGAAQSGTEDATTSPGQIADIATTVATADTTPVTSQNGADSNGRIMVSPRARKLAKELKVELTTLKGSGPHGRIVAEDVEAAAKGGTSSTTPATTTPTVPSAPVTPPLHHCKERSCTCSSPLSLLLLDK
jgi:pyruvate dehydrogenase E2 component (dihydrolipoamide acetyltransferase)